ncbi:DUF397 domain-containing protein [Sphaerisporangium sp. TRM90804]|uniref:DUF397 domain-containing protein n=1 Tax=Sphaerisporangium sp. TRM90804 TaxID=3031113 RepID=UPI00244CB32B|nr:DUF397 domain-containing protein [Sphaerisporangium sp. TRM90804]MDH2430043.1 DUF397 domain-containing protein [Sphaerisporangium sp. TRM90804]
MTRDLRAARWRKSAYSADQGDCVEVASNLLGVRAVRDSKSPAVPALVVSSAEWSAFVNGIKRV